MKAKRRATTAAAAKPKSKGKKPAVKTADDGRRKDGTFTGRHPWAFQPGQSGNPAGRRPSITLSAAYKQKLASVCEQDPHGRTWAEVIAEGMIVAAAQGKTAPAKELRETTEGSTVNHAIDWKKTLGELGVDPQAAMAALMKEVDGQLPSLQTEPTEEE